MSVNLPYDERAEKSVLAACIGHENVAQEVVFKLKRFDFFVPKNQKIFVVIDALINESVEPDAITIISRLDDNSLLSAVGGESYILELCSTISAMLNWPEHVEILRRKSTERRLIEAAEKIKSIAEQGCSNPVETIDKAQKLILDVADSVAPSSTHLATDLTREVIDEACMDAPLENIMFTGFPSLDIALGGLRGGQLLVLAARPGVGKTTFAENIALNAAQDGSPVIFFSLEMSGKDLATRLISMTAQVPAQCFMLHQLTDLQIEMANSAQEDLLGTKIIFEDSLNPTVASIRAIARRALHNQKSGLIIIDYLQLMNSDDRHENRSVEVASITRGLKRLAMDLNVPIIALSQLNRQVVFRDGRRPQLSDLRESGSIEQDADIVMFLDRSLDEVEASNDDRPNLGEAVLTVAKNRRGETGDIPLVFVPQCTKFYESAC